MIPILCVLIFSIVGTWMMIDPLPSALILNFPEVVGRVTFVLWYRIVTSRIIFNTHARLMPIMTIFYYTDLVLEAKIMSETPIGGHD